MRECWVDQNTVLKLGQVEKQLLGHMKVTFQAGKGNNHLVPVLIPDNTAEALQQLLDVERRKEYIVQKGNSYLFPCIYGSHNHVNGWHAVGKVCIYKQKWQIQAYQRQLRYATLTLANMVSYGVTFCL